MGSRSQNWMAGAIRILMKERQLKIPRSVVSLPIAATVAKRQVSFAETTVIHVPFENKGRKPSHSRKHFMTELPAMEQIQEQIVESIKEGPQERVQQHTVGNVRAPVPTVWEQLIVQETPGVQVVERIQKQIAGTLPQERVQQRTVEQNMCMSVPTVQEKMNVQGIPRVQVGERIQEQIAETISQESVQQCTGEQIEAVSAPSAATASPSTPVSVIEHATLAPVGVFTKTASMIDLMPAPVIEYIAPSAAVSYPSFFPSFDQIHEAVTDSENPQFSITADETSQMSVERIQEQSAVSDLVTSVESSPVVDSVPLLHAVEYVMPESRVPAPQVREQMNVQEIPGTQVVDTKTNC